MPATSVSHLFPIKRVTTTATTARAQGSSPGGGRGGLGSLGASGELGAPRLKRSETPSGALDDSMGLGDSDLEVLG